MRVWLEVETPENNRPQNCMVFSMPTITTTFSSFRDSTTADVSVCVGIDSGSISAGIVGSTKWHYDVIGVTVDNAILLQSNAVGRFVYIKLCFIFLIFITILIYLVLLTADTGISRLFLFFGFPSFF